MNSTKLYFLFFFFCSVLNSLFAQTDTSFWFAAPKISSSFNYNQPIVMRITTYQLSAIVSLSQPAGGGMPTQTITIPANSSQTVDLTTWLNFIECKPANVLLNNGLKITSNNKISVYYEVNVNGPNPEIFSLKGRNALGKQFYISSQTFLNNSSTFTDLPYSSFSIISTEDNNQITINPTHDIVGHLANIPFVITLNRGQTYAAIATSQVSFNHLLGSYVNSTKPIAITLADDLLEGGPQYGGLCQDMIGDQTVPISIVGDEYIAFKSFLNSPYDKLYITATQNNTSITQDGILITTINAGQSVTLSITTPVSYIKTSLPAYAYQMSGFGCEVGSAILPKINCTGSSSVSITRSTNENLVINLLVKSGGQNGFLVNNVLGIITPPQFTVVPNTAGLWYYASISLPLSTYPNGSVINISNSMDVFQLELFQGGVLTGSSSGYFSDFNTLEANAFVTNSTICFGANLNLFSDAISSAISYSWTGPNGFTSNLQNPTITNVTNLNTGDYILSINVSNCTVKNDTVNVQVNNKLTSIVNKTICEGQTYLGYNSTGNFTDIFTANNGCDSTRILNLTVNPKQFTSINQTICQGQKYLGRDSTGIYIDTLNAANGCDSIRTLNLTVNPIIYTNVNKTICKGEVYEGHHYSGIYMDSLHNILGCDSIKKLVLQVIDNTKPNLGPDKALCFLDTNLILRPGIFDSYLWQDGSTNSIFTVLNAGKYSVQVQNSCGIKTDSIELKSASCEIYFPNVFTPNGDGKNDFFNIIDTSILYNYTFKIYDRWGVQVFETNDYKKGWDGRYKSSPCDIGTYVWTCEFVIRNKFKRLKGNVLLLR